MRLIIALAFIAIQLQVYSQSFYFDIEADDFCRDSVLEIIVHKQGVQKVSWRSNVGGIFLNGQNDTVLFRLSIRPLGEVRNIRIRAKAIGTDTATVFKSVDAFEPISFDFQIEGILFSSISEDTTVNIKKCYLPAFINVYEFKSKNAERSIYKLNDLRIFSSQAGFYTEQDTSFRLDFFGENWGCTSNFEVNVDVTDASKTFHNELDFKFRYNANTHSLQSKQGEAFRYELFDLSGRKVGANNLYRTRHCLGFKNSGSIHLCYVFFANGETEVIKLAL